MSIFSTIGHIVGGAVDLATGNPGGALNQFGQAVGIGGSPTTVSVPTYGYPTPPAGGFKINLNPPFGGAPGAGISLTTPQGYYGAGVGQGTAMPGAGSGTAVARRPGAALCPAGYQFERGKCRALVLPDKVTGKCPSGYHRNKHGYFLESGHFVPKGSKCVRNRRMNPLNPRALDRSLRRMKGAERFVKSYEKALGVTTRKTKATLKKSKRRS